MGNGEALASKNHSAVIGDSGEPTEWLSCTHSGTLASNESGTSSSASLPVCVCGGVFGAGVGFVAGWVWADLSAEIWKE